MFQPRSGDMWLAKDETEWLWQWASWMVSWGWGCSQVFGNSSTGDPRLIPAASQRHAIFISRQESGHTSDCRPASVRTFCMQAAEMALANLIKGTWKTIWKISENWRKNWTTERMWTGTTLGKWKSTTSDQSYLDPSTDMNGFSHFHPPSYSSCDPIQGIGMDLPGLWSPPSSCSPELACNVGR